MRLKKMLAGAVVALSCMTWSCVSYAGSADAFQWNDKLYNQIIKKTDSLDVQKKLQKYLTLLMPSIKVRLEKLLRSISFIQMDHIQAITLRRIKNIPVLIRS